MDFIHFLLLAVILAVPRILLFIFARAPKPLTDLICIVTGGAGEIGQAVSFLFIKLAHHDNFHSWLYFLIILSLGSFTYYVIMEGEGGGFQMITLV